MEQLGLDGYTKNKEIVGRSEKLVPGSRVIAYFCYCSLVRQVLQIKISQKHTQNTQNHLWQPPAWWTSLSGHACTQKKTSHR